MSPYSLAEELEQRLLELRADPGQLVVLTGAGISAESGIPTFRGKEGYWTVGSREYQPEEMATRAMFSQSPEAVWSWYLYRRRVCRAAEPNAGHRAVVELERALGDRFLLITQNVDGLHLRAGSSPERTYQIHGNIELARCFDECGAGLQTLPPELRKERGEALTEADREALRCRCGAWLRPHVLWFDECYDEEHFRFHSSLAAASRARALVVVGTSGATNLPLQVGHAALAGGALLLDINPEPNPFSQLARSAGPGGRRGFYLQGPATAYLPLVAAALAGGAG